MIRGYQFTNRSRRRWELYGHRDRHHDPLAAGWSGLLGVGMPLLEKCLPVKWFIVTKPLGVQPSSIWGDALSAREHMVKGHVARPA